LSARQDDSVTATLINPETTLASIELDNKLQPLGLFVSGLALGEVKILYVRGLFLSKGKAISLFFFHFSFYCFSFLLFDFFFLSLKSGTE
jgi:hypothetical protein